MSTFSGFPIPREYMLGWIRWFHYINPTYYGYDSLMMNEFHGRTFDCSAFVPSGSEYQTVSLDQKVCSVTGSSPGQSVVLGDAFVAQSYGFQNGHKRVNIAYIIAIIAVLLVGYILAIEFNPGERSKGDVLVFQRRGAGQRVKPRMDIENKSPTVFCWKEESCSLPLTSMSPIIMQIIPIFVLQRTLYEARERPSKTYSWQSFLLANITVELVWNSLIGVLCFVAWYYPIGLYRNAEPTDAVHSRGFLVFLLIWAMMLSTSTLAHLLIAGLGSGEAASGLATILYELLLLFCGVLAGPDKLPGFWIFMYRVNPLTYLIVGLLSASLANSQVTCAENEYLMFNAPPSNTCAEYLSFYISAQGGYLLRPEDTTAGAECKFCQISETNTFLASVNASFELSWRNFGIMWAYVVFNMTGAVGLYWLAKVPKRRAIS
ncbi:ABC-2 type transporter-domain-containing protein [Aspergillus undulatus]|uniref:ABC-2 type transporter-domain-containing protein n=1 Tax=Aspergillus undulatus TaxID=1810928 RepID=UPI003CCD7569